MAGSSISFILVHIISLLICCLFMVLCHFQHCTGHITTGSWKGRGNQYKVLYCKLPTNGKQLPAFPLEDMPGTEPWPQRWEARVLPLCHRTPPPLLICEFNIHSFKTSHIKHTKQEILKTVHLKALHSKEYKYKYHGENL